MKTQRLQSIAKAASFGLLIVLTTLAIGNAQQIAIDFSTAGYGGGGVALPALNAVLIVRPSGGDDTATIQAAIDRIASMPVDRDGFRGALVLIGGEFQVAGQLKIRQSGIVLRGNQNATIKATGQDRRALIDARPAATPELDAQVRVTDEMVPAGGTALQLESVEGFKVGDQVVITRPCTTAWITALGRPASAGRGGLGLAGGSNWTAGSRELKWDRTISEIDAAKKQITIDSQMTTALESKFGGATVARVASNPGLNHIGIEGLILESAFDQSQPKDEEHSWFAIRLDGVQDAWVRDVTARHFVSSTVHVGPHGRRITIANCRSEQPISEPGGYRRNSFLVEGQQVLVQNCYSEAGMCDFGLGLLAAGPNVFLDCQSKGSLDASGALESYASGALFERVKIDGAAMKLTYDATRTQASGWTAGNCVVWNSQAASIDAKGPEIAPNIVSNSTDPLYEMQLKARGKSLPALSAISPAPQGLEEIRAASSNVAMAQINSHPVSVVNGYFVIDGKALWGGAINEGWWKGAPQPSLSLASGGVSISRFVPGREGPGLTENLPSLAARMVANKTPFYQSIPGLWYDRRQDAHTTDQRPDGNTWAPFLELPWARSGQGVATDGLSKYDLTRFNPWYYQRFREFARLCDQNGLVMIHHLYDTHNVLEIPPHWNDYAFRPKNNINETNLPEPPPADGTPGGKNLHLGNQVYNVESPQLRELHRKFILHELDSLGDQPNVIFSLSFQFVGPLAFQQFFQDTVAEWEKQHGKHVKIALITTKDITDAILNDPVRSKQVVMVDTRYWQYRPDGSLFAPLGGRNLAFREMMAEAFRQGGDNAPATSAEQAYRQVREYRDKYPQLALAAWNNGVGAVPAFMAGAAQVAIFSTAAGHNQGPQIERTSLDPFIQQHFSAALMNMSPNDRVAGAAWSLADQKLKNILVYSASGPSITLDAELPVTAYSATWFDPAKGTTQPCPAPTSWAKGTVLTKPDGNGWMLALQAGAPE